VDAIVLSLVSAFLFGAMTVALRVALRRGNAEVGAFVTVLTAFVLVAAYALLASASFETRGLAIFALTGLLAPGGSQLLFTLAVRDAGASRTSVVVGAAPLFAVAIALVFLREPFRLPLALGAILVVAGGTLLASDRARPAQFLAVGLVLAGASALLIATRDNVVRAVSDDLRVDPSAGAAAALLAGGLAMLCYAAVRRPAELRSFRDWPPFVPVGILFAISYALLYEAYFRGRVTVVSPLVATEALWGVGLSALLIGRSERVGLRLVLGALLIVAGGALIGARAS
jgi:drug/metabolite transporter (DMT)-like permease